MRSDRRKQSVRSIFHGAVNPRRQENRRPDDDQVYVLDIHDKSLCALGLAIVLMSCVDAMFTLKILSLGGEELNIAMKILLDTDTVSFLMVKYLMTASGVVFLILFARYRMAGVLRVRRILEGICGFYACLMIYEVYLLVVQASIVSI